MYIIQPYNKTAHTARFVRLWRWRYGAKMKFILLFIFTLYTEISISSECNEISPTLNEFIKNQASQLRGGEYCKFRKHYKDQNIELVTYTIEGACLESLEFTPGSCGNKYSIYLAGISHGVLFSPIQIGGKGIFHPESISIDHNTITISGKGYGASDPMCCPTSIENRVIFINNSVLELQPHNSGAP